MLCMNHCEGHPLPLCDVTQHEWTSTEKEGSGIVVVPGCPRSRGWTRGCLSRRSKCGQQEWGWEAIYQSCWQCHQAKSKLGTRAVWMPDFWNWPLLLLVSVSVFLCHGHSPVPSHSGTSIYLFTHSSVHLLIHSFTSRIRVFACSPTHSLIHLTARSATFPFICLSINAQPRQTDSPVINSQ